MKEKSSQEDSLWPNPEEQKPEQWYQPNGKKGQKQNLESSSAKKDKKTLGPLNLTQRGLLASFPAKNKEDNIGDHNHYYHKKR